MGITPATYAANGDVMTYTKVDAQIAAARAWMNGGIVTADIAASAIGREHIVRPKFWGQPVYGMVGRVMQRYGWIANAHSAATRTSYDMARARDRDSFQPWELTPPDTGLWRTRFGTTLYVPRASTVEVICQGMFSLSADLDWVYPDESSNHVVGRLVLGRCDRQDLRSGLAIEDESSHEIYPSPDALTGVYREHFMCAMLVTLAVGHHDLLLLYSRGIGAGHTDPLQFDIRTVNWAVTVMPDP